MKVTDSLVDDNWITALWEIVGGNVDDVRRPGRLSFLKCELLHTCTQRAALR
jgi:hypothetical protein